MHFLIFCSRDRFEYPLLEPDKEYKGVLDAVLPQKLTSVEMDFKTLPAIQDDFDVDDLQSDAQRFFSKSLPTFKTTGSVENLFVMDDPFNSGNGLIICYALCM